MVATSLRGKLANPFSLHLAAFQYNCNFEIVPTMYKELNVFNFCFGTPKFTFFEELYNIHTEVFQYREDIFVVPYLCPSESVTKVYSTPPKQIFIVL